MKLIKSIILILFSLFIIGELFAEDKEYSVTILEKNVEFYYEENNLQKYTFQQKYLINNQKGAESWNYTSSSWSPWYQEKPVITATVTNPDGQVYVLDQSTLVEVGTEEDNDIYSDTKKLKAPLASIKIGSIVDEKVVKVMTKPYFSGGYDTSYSFFNSKPINKNTITINVPKDIDIIFKEFMMDFNPKIEIKNNRKIYTISLEDLEALDSKPLLVGSDYRHWPKLYWTTSNSWNSVVKEYQKLITPQLVMDNNVESFLKNVDLTGTKEEIIINILMHLHEEVRYTGLELGESSIVPHTPNETIERKYGDCKDKAVLLQSILKEVGIKSNIALLKAGYGPDVPTEIPGIRHFNHAIVYLPKPFDIWIDATSEFSRLGELPVSSSNRNALVIDDKTTTLKKTTSKKEKDNTRILTHNVYMNQLGEAKVVEKLEVSGFFGRDRRSYFNSLSPKETDEKIGNYVERTYNSEEFVNFNKLNSRDIKDNFFYEFTVPETNYAYTDTDSAYIYLNLVDVFNILPKSLKSMNQYEKNNGEKEDSQWFERTQDVYLDYPFINNHNYIIHFPEGFVINELPKDEEHLFGTTKYSRTFKQDENKIIINSQLNTGSAKYNPEELEKLRTYLFKNNNEKNQKIIATSFKNLYINNDEFQNCINYYLDKIESEPNDISHHVRIAAAYIEAGFAKAGNKHLKIALTLDEDNTEAKMAYALSFLYDEWGRYEYLKDNKTKATKEYLEVTQINPEIGNAWRNLAIISEYGDEGFRYSSGADFEGAINYYNKYTEYTKEDDLNYNILLDLVKLNKFDELLNNVELVKKLNTYDGWSLYFTAIVLKNGDEIAYKQISSLTSSPDNRKRLIDSTVTNLQQLREYKLAAKMLSYIDKSTDKYIEIENKIDFLNSLSHYEDEVFDESRPENVVQKYWFKAFVKEDLSSKDVGEIFAKKLIENVGTKHLLEEMTDAKDEFEFNSLNASSNLNVMRDMLLTEINYNVEQAGDLYRIITTVNLPTEQISQQFFVWKEDGKFKLIHNQDPWLASDSITKMLKSGKRIEAIKILNWIKDGADNRNFSSILSSVWKSNKRSDDWINMGVASLTYKLKESTNFLLGVEQAFIKNGLRDIYTWMLAIHYKEKKEYKKAYDLIKKHIANEGLSTEVVGDYFYIYHKNDKHEEFHKILMESLEFEPNNLILHDQVVYNYVIQKRYTEAFDYLESYIENSSESAFMYNNIAWHGLFSDQDFEQLHSYALTANQITKFEKNAFLDTLAVILAESGKVKQSREILLHLIGQKKSKHLDGEYYIMGLNAVTLGLNDEAINYFSQVKKPEIESGISTYLLAQKKLKELK
ncbi:MAG: DUF3857 domain-containing protein [Spirochaetaceae bacterium]